LVWTAVLSGCGGQQKKDNSEAELDRMAFARPAPLLVKGVGFAQPAAAIYDRGSDTYLVSNVSGDPLEKDDNGFISRVAPDGKVLELKWIDGEMAAKTLHAPKGMAISDTRLFVADIDVVRIFDRTTGAALGVIHVPKASYLNGVSVAPNGTVYVSDTGLKKPAEPKADADKGAKGDAKGDAKKDGKADAKPEPKPDPSGLEPSGTESIWQISKYGALKRLAKGDELHRPSGLAADDSGVWVSSWLEPELYRITKWGKREDPSPAPSAQLQGMVRLPDGATLLSSIKNSAVYIGHPGGAFNVALDKVRGAGGLGYDTKRRRVLVPLDEGVLEIQELSGFEETDNRFGEE
jgi:sugar lactone lactonase YvrE